MHDDWALAPALLDGKRERTSDIQFFDPLYFPEQIGGLGHFDVGAVPPGPARELLRPSAHPAEKL